MESELKPPEEQEREEQEEREIERLKKEKEEQEIRKNNELLNSFSGLVDKLQSENVFQYILFLY